MKKYIFGTAFSLALLASPAFTQATALTSTQISAIVSLLQSFGADQTTINNVQVALGGTSTTIQFCHNFNINLAVGSSGDEVLALSQALSNQVLSVPVNSVANYFDEDVAQAVIAFQAKYGIKQTGYVGPITRAKLNALYGCNTTQPSITISRTPATSATNPFKVGDATVSSSVSSPSLFTGNLTGTGYNQIGAGTPRTFSFTIADLVSSGQCNATTGICNSSGNWDVTSLLCPAGVTGIQQMTEWYTVGNTTSNKIQWYFQCSGTTPTTNAKNPVGSLASIDANGIASGWAVDPDATSTPISVHFYIGGAAGQGGTYAGSAVANIASTTVNDLGYPGNHGFSWQIPSQWRDGKPHTLYVHGIDLSGDGSKNVLLSNVPKSFTLETPTTAHTAQLYIDPQSIDLSVGEQVQVSASLAPLCPSGLMNCAQSLQQVDAQWTSADSNIAKIIVAMPDCATGQTSSCSASPRVYVAGVAQGTTTIRALYSNFSTAVTAVAEVTVAPHWTAVSSGGHITQKLHYISPTKIYGIGLDYRIYRWNGGGSWTPITTSGHIKSDFYMVNDSESDILAFGLDDRIWHWDGSSWTQASFGGGQIQRLFYVSPSQTYGIGLDGGIWRWNGASSWTQITRNGSFKDDFVLINESDIYGIGLDNQIWHWNGSSFSQHSFGGGQLKYRLQYVSPTKIYGIGLDGGIWRYNGGGSSCTFTTCWTQITRNGSLKDDFVLVNNDENNIYAIGTDGQIWHWQ